MKRWQLAWMAIVVAGLVFNLGGYGLIEPDEGRNAEVAREMAATNDYVLPHLNGLPYLDKPIVFFAAAAASIEVFGANEWAVRLPSFSFGLATAVLVFFFARRVFGPQEAFVAFVATATAPLAAALSRIVIMDTTLSFFVVLGLIAFYFAIEGRRRSREEGRGSRTWIGWTLLAWMAMGVGVLTKGPVALAVPLLAAAPYAVWRRASLAVWHPIGAVVLALNVAPWVWAVTQEIPNFLEYVVLTETVSRMTTDELRRSNPFWYFVPVLLAGTFPWSLLALSSLRRKSGRGDGGADHRRAFLWLWLLVPFAMFTLSSGKQVQYVLPLVPAVALLAATGGWPRKIGIRVAAVGWGAIGLALVVGAGLGLPGIDAGQGDLSLASRTALAIGCVALMSGGFGWFFSRRRAAAVAALSVPMVFIPLLTTPAMDLVVERRSTQALAGAIEERLDDRTEILAVEAYAPSLSFYLEREIPLLSVDGDELRSNYIVRNADLWLADDGPLRPVETVTAALWNCDRPRVFLVDKRDHDMQFEIERTGVSMLDQSRKLVAYGPHCQADQE